MAGKLKFCNEDIERILFSNAFEKYPSRNRALFIVQLCLGPRIQEMLDLTIGDVVDSHGQIKSEITFTKTKTGDPRTLKVINKLIFHFLPDWLECLRIQGFMHESSPLFPGRSKIKSLSVRRVRYIYQEAIDEITPENEDLLRFREKHSTHSCRKTWACQTFDWLCEEREKGAKIEPLAELKELGGWATIDNAAKYINDHISRANESQAAIFGGLMTILEQKGRVPKRTKQA